MSADVRLLKSDDSGSAKAGTIDSRIGRHMLGYALGGHEISAGWQRMNGDTSMPYLDNNPYLVNYLQVNDFANAQERSWQLRYDYDFKAIGIGGLWFPDPLCQRRPYQGGGQQRRGQGVGA